jgi:hypothetical protein
MTTKLPVPSKAALTALQGLIAGTGCTLLLVAAEDRRRRLANARHVLDNAEKLKSNKRYYRGGAAAVLAVEEGEQFEPEMIAWTKDPRTQQWTGQRSLVAPSKEGNLDVRDFERLLLEQPPPTVPAKPESTAKTKSVIRKSLRNEQRHTPVPAQFKIAPESITTSVTASETPEIHLPQVVLSKTTAETFQTVESLCKGHSKEDATKAAHLLMQWIRRDYRTSDVRRTFFQLSELVCQTCVKLKQADLAARLLRAISDQNVISLSVYKHHRPLEIIDALLADVAALEGHAGLQRKNLELAIATFLPNTKPARHAEPTYAAMGRRLLKFAIAHGCIARGDEVLRRIFAYGEIDFDLIRWYMVEAQQKHMHKQVISLFEWAFYKDGFQTEANMSIVDLAVGSCVAQHGARAQYLLRLLAAGSFQLTSETINKLLTAYWERTSSLSKTMAEFESLEEKLDSLVSDPASVYRGVMEIAMHAEDGAMAEHFHKKLEQSDKSLASEAGVLGVLTLLKAREGKWEAVRRDFTTWKTDATLSLRARSEVFVPILKQYVRRHTLGETEIFLKSFVDAGLIQVEPGLLGIMTRQYGEKGDIRSLLQWLEYCAGIWSKPTSRFSNAVLTTCRDHWHFRPSELRMVANKLHRLNPALIDDNTRRIYLQAHLSAGHSGTARPLYKRLASDPLGTLAMDMADATKEQDVILAMSQAVAAGEPAKAVELYLRAVRLGMRQNCGLHLAVLACVQRDNTAQSAEAMKILRDAQKAGHDIGKAIGPVLDAYFRVLDEKHSTDTDGKSVNRDIRSILGRFERNGIELNEYALLRASRFCTRNRQYRSALRFAIAASQVGAEPEPLYANVFSFGAALLPYAALNNTRGVASAVSAALKSSYVCSNVCLKAMKDGRLLLKRWHEDAESTTTWKVLTDAIQVVVEKRKALADDKTMISSEVLSIVREAAAKNELHMEVWRKWSPEEGFGPSPVPVPDQRLYEPRILTSEEDWESVLDADYEQPEALIAAH